MKECAEREMRKECLIEELLKHGIYKTAGQEHLYNAPLAVLEVEYAALKQKTFSACS